MNERDEGYMLEAVDKIMARTPGLARTQYDADEDKQIVFTHLVQIVGEAASRVSEETRDAFPQVSWPQIIGTRHRLVHDYVHVDTNILWDIITADIPDLHTNLLAILPADKDKT